MLGDVNKVKVELQLHLSRTLDCGDSELSEHEETKASRQRDPERDLPLLLIDRDWSGHVEDRAPGPASDQLGLLRLDLRIPRSLLGSRLNFGCTLSRL